MKMGQMNVADLAVTPADGGNTVLAYFTQDLSGATHSGIDVPGTQSKGAVNNAKWTFNDQGLVTAYDLEWQTEIVEEVSHAVARYEEHQNGGTQMSSEPWALESWARVGEKNIATVKKVMDIGREMQGKQITAALVLDLAKKQASLYTNHISCSFMKGTKTGVSLKDVSLSQCSEAAVRAFGNLKMGEFSMKNSAIDPASGGAVILSYLTQDMSATTSSGEDVPGTEVNGMILNTKYSFNKQGLISGFDTEFQSEIVEEMVRAAVSYEKSHRGGEQEAMNFSASPWIRWVSESSCAAFAIGFLAAALVLNAARKKQRSQPTLLEGYMPA